MTHRHNHRAINLPHEGNGTIAVISDTHGKPHSNLFSVLKQGHPSLILHAGDIGDLDLITELKGVSQTVFVRGNTDPSGPMWPDSIALRILVGGTTSLDLLLLHFAVARLRLIREAQALLRQNPAQVVVFGHSHMPFIGMDGKTGLFNPGSAGPSRMGLPVTMGVIEVIAGQLKFKHLDLQTGNPWNPGGDDKKAKDKEGCAIEN